MTMDSRIEALKGNWENIDSENFDGILKNLEVNQELRTIANNNRPRVRIDEKDGEWSLTSDFNLKQTSVEFTPGVQFSHISPDGKPITMLVEFREGKWFQRVRYEDGKEMFVQRWVNEHDQLEVAMECGCTKASQLFKRID